MKYIYKVPNICNIDIRGTNACAGGSEGQRNMGNNRRNIEREERWTTLQTRWLFFMDKEEREERERKTKKE